jgi:hypothetical protein
MRLQQWGEGIVAKKIIPFERNYSATGTARNQAISIASTPLFCVTMIVTIVTSGG